MHLRVSSVLLKVLRAVLRNQSPFPGKVIIILVAISPYSRATISIFAINVISAMLDVLVGAIDRGYKLPSFVERRIFGLP